MGGDAVDVPETLARRLGDPDLEPDPFEAVAIGMDRGGDAVCGVTAGAAPALPADQRKASTCTK